MDQLNERELQQHVTILGWLLIAANAIFLLVGLCGFLLLAGIGLISADPTAMNVLGIIAIVSILFFGALAVPGILAGYGLLKRTRWGQILAIVVGFLSLVNVPLGTALGIYALFVLLQNSATDYFAA
jgi:hypothetical protein